MLLQGTTTNPFIPLLDPNLAATIILDKVKALSVPEDVAKILGPNEKLELYIQQKIYHPKINIDSVVLTNERIIFRHPHALRLKKDYTDYSYKDISDVVLDKGILRSTIKLTLKPNEEKIDLGELPNSQAEKAYGIIRENIGKFQTPFSTGYAAVQPGPNAPNPPK